MNFRKCVKVISILLFEGILLLAGGILGLESERSRMKKEEQAEIVTDIAVVNLDEGIYENNKKRFYSTELMNLEADNLVSENLETAREGINNGSYAAYILIPAEFSANAVSINSIPQKSILEFAVNPNLREDVSRLTMANIKNFEITLNTNMSYMYVQAVLEEFHNVQDSSGTIMENDSTELARILGINPEKLMTNLELTPIERVNADIEDVNFDEAFEINSQIALDLLDNYDSFVTMGEEDLIKIKENEDVVLQGVDTFYTVMSEIDVETDAEGNVVYEGGIIALEEYLKEYDSEFKEKRSTIAQMAGIEETPTPSATPTETISPSPGQTPSASISPTPGTTPVASSSPGATPAETTSPVATSTPTASPTPTEVPVIPELLEKMLDEGLVKVNKRIQITNNANKEHISEARELIDVIRLSLNGAEQTIQRTVPGEDEAPVDEETPGDDEAPVDEETPGDDEAPVDEETPEEDEDHGDEEMPQDSLDSSDLHFVLYAAKSPNEIPVMDMEIIVQYLDQLEVLFNEIEETEKVKKEEIYDEEIIKDGFNSLMVEIDNLPQVNVGEYNGIFNEQVMKPLQEEVLAENTKIQEEGTKCMETMDVYVEELVLFDPYEYYDYEKMDELLYNFEDNIFKLEDDVSQTYEDYTEYAFNAVDTANESMLTLKEDLNTAYEGTTDNVQQEIDLAKQYRQQMNETNIEILGDFRKKLPYTRIGNLEYVQAYDFMVKPIKMSDASVSKDRVLIFQDYEALRNILIAMIIMWFVSVCGLLFMKLHAESGIKPDKE